jgi:hypothetical protein
VSKRENNNRNKKNITTIPVLKERFISMYRRIEAEKLMTAFSSLINATTVRIIRVAARGEQMEEGLAYSAAFMK